MKTNRVAVLVFLMSILVAGIPYGYSGQIVEDRELSHVLQPRGLAPLHFIPNQGQLGEHIKYYAKNAKQEIYFTDDGVYLAIAKGKLGGDPLFDPFNPSRTESHSIETQIIRLAPVNMLPQAEIAPEDLRQAKVNWYMGNDQQRWRTGIPTYGAVSYHGAQDGLDLKFYGQDRQLEYDLIVKPGQDPSQIRMSCSGVDYFELTEEGDLVINLKGGATLVQKKPKVYQVVNGDRVSVDGGFRVEGPEATPSRNGMRNLASAQPDEMVYGFDIGSYDRSLPVVIDPVIMYADYLELGGAGEDYAMAIDVDSAGCAYMAGYTWSTSQSLSATGAIRLGTLTTTNYNIFVKKFDALGGDAHTTYIGGNNNSRAYAIASDATGNVYLTGQTSATSPSFPLKDALYSTNRGNGDAFLTKLYADGTLAYSTFLGGTKEDLGYGIAVDSSGSAYITGFTYSLDFPRSAGAFCTTHSSGAMDAFITKINTVTKTLAYSTLLGRENSNSGTAIAVDSSGSAYVTGWTYSSDFPVSTTPFQSIYRGMQDAFVLKLNATGSALTYSTFLGGTGADVGMGIAVDSSGNAYVTGKTDSADFPLGGDRSLFGSTKRALTDGFVAKLNSTGSALAYSLFLGGNDVDIPHGIRVNAAGEAFVVGETASGNFPMLNAFQGEKDSYRAAFVTKLNAAGSNALFSSYYLGNSGNDIGTGIALDKSPTATGVYFTGYTTTADLYSNAFAVKLDDVNTPSVTIVSPNGGESIPAGTNKTIRWSYIGAPDTTVTIELLRDAEVVATLATAYTIGTGGNGYFAWTVPCDQESGSNYKIQVTTTNGTYSDQSDQAFTISEAIPSPDFTANGVDVSQSQVAVAAGDEIQFQDASSCGAPVYRAWDFGDGETSDAKDPKHTYKKDGQYDVSLTLTGPGWERTKYRWGYIQVNVPNPIFSASDDPAGVNKEVTFTNTSTGTVTSWLWDFGDSTTSTEKNPKHTFTNAGTYTVRLTATGPSGSRFKEISLQVVDPPVADFSASPAPAAVGDDIQFTDASTGYISSRSWSFGDSATSTDTSPKHTYTTYPSGGNYDVTLTVTNPAGSHSVTKTVDVGLPNPDFTTTPASPVGVHKPVTFTGTATGRDLSTWKWEFGDGDFVEYLNSDANHATPPPHTYTTTGDKNVTLTVTGASGSRSKTKTIKVAGPPVAEFSAAPTVVATGDQVQFTDASQDVVTSWEWQFGDGGTSTEQNPKHAYATNGTYTVTLTVHGPGGDDTIIKDHYIDVSVPNPDFVATPTTVVVDHEVSFTDQSTGNIETRSWQFGDGGTSSAQNPVHVYTTPGTYSVSLEASGPTGSRSITKTAYIKVVEVPVAAFTAAPNPVAMGAAVQFTDASTGEITSWLWNFGDGRTSTEQNPQHAFSAVGNYTVTLTVTGPGGAHSTTQDITVTLPTITVISPNGGEAFHAGDNVTIQWNYAGSVGTKVKIELFKAGVRVATVTLGTPVGSDGTGSYNYVIPVQRTPGTDYQIKVTSTTVATYQDASDSNFTITGPPPVAAFRGLPLSGNPPLSVKFSNTTTGTVNTWEWDFGGGATSPSKTPTYAFGPGVHTVKLTATGPGGSDVEEKTDYIKVNPAADFTADIKEGYEALTVHFTDNSNGGNREITSWLWNFGDGGTSTEQNPTHVYTTPGKYNVTLKVTNEIGSGQTVKSAFITVLLANFTATPTNGSAPLNVSFMDKSDGSPNEWTWDFGDESEPSHLQNPTHTYETPGVYTVTLTVKGPKGTGTETKTNYITLKPDANFSASSTTGYAPFSVSFSDTSIGEITSWAWTFGDGGSSTDKNPTHTYTAPGTYTVTLSVYGPGGSDVETKTNHITIYKTDFSATPVTGIGTLTTAFTDLSTGSPTAWEWDFGDGTPTVTEKNPTHPYATNGVYTVTLKVWNSNGTGQVTKTNYISVAPDANFNASATVGRTPLTVNFTDASVGTVTSYAWNFGDGSTSTDQNPSHVYTTAGTYTVTLTASGPGGSNVETKTSYITVYKTDFSATPLTGTGTLTTTFTDLSTGSPTSWDWDFGDGTTLSGVKNPTHTYSSGGPYTVTLTVGGPYGAGVKVKSNYITVYYTVPVANFTASTTSGPSLLDVSFTNSSTGIIDTWLWDFGDGATSTDQNPTHQYSTPGVYTVKLTATGPGGTNTKTRSSYITVTTPMANFAASTATSGPSVLEVNFNDSSTGTISTRTWNFGDGTTLETSDLSVSHSYSTPGTYTVGLTVSGPGGSNTMTRTGYVVVTAPVANFAAAATSGTAPMTVNFTDSSTGTIETRTWSFGDGATLDTTDLNVQHTYVNPGTYTVTLTVSGPGGTNTKTRSSYIVVSSPITVTYPNTAVTWTRPCTKTITWTYSGDPAVVGPNVTVEILKSGVPIAADTKIVPITDGSCSINITSTHATGTSKFKVRVTSTSNANYTDQSNSYFTIN